MTYRRPRGIGRGGTLAAALLAMLPVVCVPANAGHESDGAAQAAAAEGLSARSVLNGYRRYNASCNHCHGPDGVGSSFGPGLIAAPLDEAAFRDAVLHGRASGLSVMKGFAGDPNVAPHVADIYVYLRARAEGRVGRGRPRPDP